MKNRRTVITMIIISFFFMRANVTFASDNINAPLDKYTYDFFSSRITPRDSLGLQEDIRNQILLVSRKIISEDKELAKIFSEKINNRQFSIVNGEIIIDDDALMESEQLQGYRQLWEIIRLLDFNENISLISEFNIRCDGFGKIVGYVSQDPSEPGHWIMTVDPMDLLESDGSKIYEFYITLIHELAHIDSLNASQMIENGSVTGTYITDEGQLKTESYLNSFYEKFWMGEFTDDSGTNYNRNDFVNRYASTNVTEDYAETFAYWVCTNHDNYKDTAIEEKFNFFSAYEEFNKYRTRIQELIS